MDKVRIKPILTQTVDTPTETTRTQKRLGTSKMIILRKLTGKTLNDIKIRDTIQHTPQRESINA